MKESPPVDLNELTTMVYTMVDAASQALQESTTGISSLNEALSSIENRLSSLEPGVATLEDLVRHLKGQFADAEDAIIVIEQRTKLEKEGTGRLDAKLQIIEEQLALVEKTAADHSLIQNRLHELEHLAEQTRGLFLRQEQQLAALCSCVNILTPSGSVDSSLSPASVDRNGHLPAWARGRRPVVALLTGGLVAAAGLAVLAAQLPLLHGGGTAMDSTTQGEQLNAQTKHADQPKSGNASDGKSLPASPQIAREGIAASPTNLLNMYCPQECWVEVSNSQGPGRLYQGLLKGSASFPLGTGLRVYSGRADILKVRVNNGPITLLDAKRQVSDRLFLPPPTNNARPATPQPPQNQQ